MAYITTFVHVHQIHRLRFRIGTGQLVSALDSNVFHLSADYIRIAMIFSVYMDDDQHARFLEGFKNSIYRHKSEYGRKLLLGKPVKVIYRNRSMDDLIEMSVGLRKDVRRLLSGETLDPILKQELLDKITSIEEQLIKLIEICGHPWTPKKMS